MKDKFIYKVKFLSENNIYLRVYDIIFYTKFFQKLNNFGHYGNEQIRKSITSSRNEEKVGSFLKFSQESL